MLAANLITESGSRFCLEALEDPLTPSDVCALQGRFALT